MNSPSIFYKISIHATHSGTSVLSYHCSFLWSRKFISESNVPDCSSGKNKTTKETFRKQKQPCWHSSCYIKLGYLFLHFVFPTKIPNLYIGYLGKLLSCRLLEDLEINLPKWPFIYLINIAELTVLFSLLTSYTSLWSYAYSADASANGTLILPINKKHFFKYIDPQLPRDWYLWYTLINYASISNTLAV